LAAKRRKKLKKEPSLQFFFFEPFCGLFLPSENCREIITFLGRGQPQRLFREPRLISRERAVAGLSEAGWASME